MIIAVTMGNEFAFQECFDFVHSDSSVGCARLIFGTLQVWLLHTSTKANIRFLSVALPLHRKSSRVTLTWVQVGDWNHLRGCFGHGHQKRKVFWTRTFGVFGCGCSPFASNNQPSSGCPVCMRAASVVNSSLSSCQPIQF